MYAVVEIGGHQYRVSEGDVLFVDKQSDDVDQALTFDRVFLTNDDGDITVGKPVIDGTSIDATLIDNVKSDKVTVFKKKRRKGYQVKRGHRQPMSQIEINGIDVSGSSSTSSKKDKEDDKQAESDEAQDSTDMLAKEAIEHIHNNDLEDLQGFVPEDESRVTVRDAWEEKQEG